MRQQRWAWTHRYAVPMFIASLVAVALSGTGLIAVLVLDDDGGGDPRSGIDPCVLGTWRTVSQTERVSSLGQDVQLTLAGEGPLHVYRGDGTASVDYGDGITLTGAALGQTVQATITGGMTYRYQAADGIFQITEIVTNQATFTVELFPGAPVDTRYEVSTATPEHYRCEADSIRFWLEERDYTAEYERLSS